ERPLARGYSFARWSDYSEGAASRHRNNQGAAHAIGGTQAASGDYLQWFRENRTNVRRTVRTMEQGSRSDAQTAHGQALQACFEKEPLAGIRRAPGFRDRPLSGAIVSRIKS